MKIRGADALARGLRDRADLGLVKQAVRHNGAELENRMKHKATFIKGYQTGTTKRSIRMDLQNGGLTARVGPTTHYSPYLELGTRFMDAQPFVRPSFNIQKQIYLDDIKRLMK